MGETRGIRGVGARDCKILGFARLDETGLPAWLSFSRATGNNSVQTGPAVNGTTFISKNLGVNVPRFAYSSGLGRRGLLLEQAAQNIAPYTDWADVAPADNCPDNWTAIGAAGVDYRTLAGGPHAGSICEIMAGAAASRGAYGSPNVTAIPATTTFCSSVWSRATGLAAGRQIYTFNKGGGDYGTLTLPTGTYDWTRARSIETSIGGAGADFCYLHFSATAFAQAAQLCLPQIEARSYATSWVPTTTAAATRANEKCLIDPTVLPTTSGYIRYLWSPQFASTDTCDSAASNTIVAGIGWTATDILYYCTSDSSIRVNNGGSLVLATAPLAFAADAKILVEFRFGASGMTLTVDGVATTTATAWVPPAVAAPQLGSFPGTNSQDAQIFADLLVARG